VSVSDWPRRVRAALVLGLVAARSAAAEAPDGYLQPNVADADGAPGFVHVTESDMPLVVALPKPGLAPAYASRAEGREAAVEGIRSWETALRPALPWFRIEFVEKDPAAAVQVRWKRRIAGEFGGIGGIGWRVEGGRLRVGGSLEVEMANSTLFTCDWIARLVAHEFGHVLGLGHCHECESVMNYAYEARERVTALDVATFVALTRRRSGQRVDGRPMQALLAVGWTPERGLEAAGPESSE
jgi:hypothetical protein